ncbi:MAG TPA: thioredoxin [Lachnoclostridium phytofermentans]|uniref:Thioredoxin n=1 Tax=Lachnoclostridium phytofermentans TaxID=66219 RepID=A0A3D2X1L3_9FIRM|nr:thioredoxin [Lachnoclostridium phytofermentans]
MTKKWAKRVIPLLIVIAIICIFLLKKESNKIDNSENMLPLEINEIDLAELKLEGLPIVIDFGSDSCIPCKQMAPVLQKLHSEWNGKAIVHFIDVWKNASASDGFPMTVIPTQFFFNSDGTPYKPSEDISNEIELSLYSTKDTGEHVFTAHQGSITEEEMKKIFMEMGVE